MSSNWDDMLTELSAAQAAQTATDVVLAKALPAEVEDKEGDEKIASAAAEGDAKDKEPDADKDDDTFGKSFGVTLEDGTKVDAYDGTAMMKSLFAEVEKTKAVIVAAFDLVKSLQSTVSTQTDMIKSLQADVQRLGSQGRGRTAVLSMHEKPAAVAAVEQPIGITGPELMTKCFAAQKLGKITGSDISRVEAYLNRGIAPPAEILARIA